MPLLASRVTIWIWTVQDLGLSSPNLVSSSLLGAIGRTVPFARPEIEQSLSTPIIVDDFISIEISEGIEEDDFTCSIRLVGDWFKRINPDTTERYVFGVGIEDRFFGVYDLESISVIGEYPVTTITGKIDLQFEETVFNHYGGIWTEILHGLPSNSRRIQPAVPLYQLVRDYDPYRRWGIAYLGLMQGAVAGSTDLSSIRNVFKEFGLGLSPVSYVVNDFDIYRDIDIYNIYPVDDNIPVQVYNYVNYDREGNPTIARDSKRFSHLISIPPEDVIMSAPPAFTIPDIYNAPGRYQNREITIESFQFQAAVTLNRSGQARPRIHLDTNSIETTFEQLVEAKRWELQNTSAEATINIKGNPNILPRQRIQLFGEILPYPNWYITSVKHTIVPDSPEIAYRTTLKTHLFQGNWQSTQQPPFTPAPIQYYLSPFGS